MAFLIGSEGVFSGGHTVVFIASSKITVPTPPVADTGQKGPRGQLAGTSLTSCVCVAYLREPVLDLQVIADLLESAPADCESENASMTSCMGDVALAVQHLSKVSENIAKSSHA